MINQTLVEFSNLAIIIAIVVYMMALISMAADLASATSRRSNQKLEAAAVREREVALVGAGAGSSAASSGAGTSAPASGAGEDSLAYGDARAEASAPYRGEGSSAGSRGVADSASGKGGVSAQMLGLIFMAAGAIFHVAGMTMRGIATQRVPWSNMYEFSMSSTAVISVVFLAVALKRRDMRLLGVFVLLPLLVTMLIAQTAWLVPAAELTPSLQNSHWLVIHIVVAVISTGLFSLGALLSIAQLLMARHETKVAAAAGVATPGARLDADTGEATTAQITEGDTLKHRLGRLLDHLPGSKGLEEMSFRLHAIGFVLWTFTLIFGAIWAREAWGRYWGWDPKEVWTFVIWVVYAAYLHARATRGFRGSRAAWFALVGFVCLIFNFTVVNTVINGLHSYSGL